MVYVLGGNGQFSSRVTYEELLSRILYLLFLQPGLLGVFQKLIASKANDHQGFYLLNSIIEHMPP